MNKRRSDLVEDPGSFSLLQSNVQSSIDNMYHFLSISKGPCTIAKRIKQVDKVRELLHVSNIVLWNLGKKLVQTTEDLAADFTGSDQESTPKVVDPSASKCKTRKRAIAKTDVLNLTEGTTKRQRNQSVEVGPTLKSLNKDVPEGSEDGPLVSTRPNDLEIPVVITGPTGICLYIYKYMYIYSDPSISI